MRYTYIAICLVAGALFWGCDEIKEPSLSAAPLRVRVELPERMQFTDSILVQGNIESQETADISSRTAGNLDRIPIDEGVRVKAGDLLFEIDRVTLENDLRSQQKKLEVAEAEQKIARIALDFSRTAAEKTRIDYQRALQLRSSEAVSADTLECAKLALDEALTGIAKAEAQANYSHAKVEQEKAAVAMAEKE